MTGAIVAAGQTRFGVHVSSSVKELFAAAVDDMVCRSDRGLDLDMIEAAYVGSPNSTWRLPRRPSRL